MKKFLILILIIGGLIMNYVICDNKCLKEAYTKEEVDAIVSTPVNYEILTGSIDCSASSEL